ncbi:MAG: hypothetical protein QM484_14410 [Woeseiaceae bacterium]
MLKAVLHGKAGRVELDGKVESISWRKLFSSGEDLLTAAIFTRWSYLSDNAQNQLMCNWFNVDENSEHDFTTFKDIQFWPQYDLAEIEGRKYVEPDVLIQFEDFNLLIEVKPPLGGDQYLEQWQNEITGYFSWEGNDSKPLYFLAIGRTDNVDDEWCQNIMEADGEKPKMLHALTWKPVAKSMYNLLKNGDLLPQDMRILSDMLNALELYGTRGYDYLWADFEKKSLPEISFETMSMFKLPYIKNDMEIDDFMHNYQFVDMLNRYNILNLEIMKKWKN